MSVSQFQTSNGTTTAANLQFSRACDRLAQAEAAYRLDRSRANQRQLTPRAGPSLWQKLIGASKMNVAELS